MSNKVQTTIGHKRLIYFDLALDSSYAAGGETLDNTSNIGIGKIDQVYIQSQKGYDFEYDYTNEKVKVFAKAPPIVYEEKHTATAYATGYSAITLDYPAAWIINVADASTNQKLVVTGLATGDLGTDECSLYAAIADDTRTVITTTSGATVYVTYATQAWTELYDQLVQAEAVTLTTGTANALDYTPMAFGYVSMGTNDNNLTFVPTAYTVNSGYIGVNPGTAATALKANSSQNTYTVTVLYLKLPDSGWLQDRWVSKEDSTNADSGSYSSATFDFSMLIPATSGAILGYTDTTVGASISMGASYTSVLYGQAHTNWVTAQTAATGSAPAAGQVWVYDGDAGATTGINGMLDAVDNSYVKGYPWEIPNLVPLEVKNETDLSGLTGIKVMVIGR